MLHAQRLVADQEQAVDRGRAGVQRLQIGAEGRETVVACAAQKVHRRGRVSARREGCERDAAIAGDHGRHPLARLGGHVAVEERAVVMGVDVDEARRDDEAAGVDLPLPGCVAQHADLRDAPAVHRHIVLARRRAGAVDDAAAPDNQFVAHVRSSFRRSLAPCLPCA